MTLTKSNISCFWFLCLTVSAAFSNFCPEIALINLALATRDSEDTSDRLSGVTCHAYR